MSHDKLTTDGNRRVSRPDEFRTETELSGAEMSLVNLLITSTHLGAGFYFVERGQIIKGGDC